MKLRIGLAAACASIVLAAYASASSATHLSIGVSTFRGVWTPATFETGEGLVRCNLTLEGSFSARSIAKRTAISIGRATNASVSSCTGGGVTVLRETLPWEVNYSSFSGTLPNITGVTVKIIGGSVQIRTEAAPACLARSTTTDPIEVVLTVVAGVVTVVQFIREVVIPTIDFLCSLAAKHLSIGGSGTPTVAGGTTQITVSLI